MFLVTLFIDSGADESLIDANLATQLGWTLDLLPKPTYNCAIDPRNAYQLVHIREGDTWTTAFNTPSHGHYENLLMPFGLTNAPAVFQALINDVLRDMINQFVLSI